MSTLTCPKCASEMRSYERNGVTMFDLEGGEQPFALVRFELREHRGADVAQHESHQDQREQEGSHARLLSNNSAAYLNP